MELLAPAGDWTALEAALEAGAGAVYFGLTTLNARRRARNFRQDEFIRAVEKVHSHGARAYLTLNIDLTERELGQAARIIELARQAGADAVLVRDPALLALRPLYPEVEFHFSTQTCMTNSSDVAAAARLGAARVVLAREMTLAEIAAASKVPKVQTEVFVQGALCFSVSGRCLLSSWAGGRSGNRGSCTSPCRVPWSIGGHAAGTPLSMRDLATVHRLADLEKTGVTGLKIEGRLKTAEWVRQAVGLYREALDRLTAEKTAEKGTVPFSSDENRDSPSVDELIARAAKLGAYTGRGMTSGYLDAQRDELTGLAGRQAAPESAPGAAAESTETPEPQSTESDGLAFDFSITIADRGIVCHLECLGRTCEWTMPKTVVRRVHKAVSVGHLLEILTAGPILGCDPGNVSTNDPEFLMVPRAANALVDRVTSEIRLARKGPGDAIRVSLPEAVQEILVKTDPHESNRRRLGDPPDRVRLHGRHVAGFLQRVRPETVIVEGVTSTTLDRVIAAAGEVPLVIALPQVLFEDDLPRLRKLLVRCKAARLPVEVNSWGAWRMARQAGVRMEGGPGLPVLNSLAAAMLRRSGIRCVTLSPEADRRQLEELTAHCPSPCSMVVFGRPPLLITRAALADEVADQVIEDRRGVRLTAATEQGLLVFRPVEPMDLRDARNERIRVRHLVVDLVGSRDPLGEWQAPPDTDRGPFHFNYDRSLA